MNVSIALKGTHFFYFYWAISDTEHWARVILVPLFSRFGQFLGHSGPFYVSAAPSSGHLDPLTISLFLLLKELIFYFYWAISDTEHSARVILVPLFSRFGQFSGHSGPFYVSAAPSSGHLDPLTISLSFFRESKAVLASTIIFFKYVSC